MEYYQKVKAEYKKAKREYITDKFNKVIRYCINHPKVVLVKTLALLELLILQPIFYKWAYTAEDVNITHILGICCLLVLFVNYDRIRHNFDM